DLPEAWLDLAAEQLALGDKAAASGSLDRALRLGIQHVEISMPAGQLALELGDSDRAVATFAIALANAPSLATDPWWQGDPGRAALLPTVVERAVTDATPDSLWAIQLILGHVEAAQAATATASDPAFAMLVIGAWGVDRSAA